MGGAVFSGDVEKAVDASSVIVTSQKEIDKLRQKLNKTLTMAYRLGWKIIFKKSIIEARNINALPSICDYELDLSNIRTAPGNSVLHSKVLTNSTMINNHLVVGGHRELKNKLRRDLKRKKPDCAVQEKSLPKKPCTAYAMFSKNVWKSIVKEHPAFTMREVNSHVSGLWKEFGDEDKRMYLQQARKTMNIVSSVIILLIGNTDVLQCISCIEMMVNIYCLIPENIHTPPQKGIFLRPPTPLDFPIKLHTFNIYIYRFFGLTEPLNPQEITIPSVGGVWIFSGTAHYAPINVKLVGGEVGHWAGI